MAGIILSPKDIFEQEFKTVMRGFDKKEVDEFLDDVIKDYETFMAQIESLKAENQALKDKLAKGETSSTTISKPSATVTQPSYGSVVAQAAVPNQGSAMSSQTATNFDILKRISRLEKEVFGKQIVE